MDVSILLRGIALGFAIAAPVGPIGVMCIRRTLAHGMAYGMISGLGAATADGIYGSIAAFGLTAASSLLVTQQQWLQLAGGAFLVYLGLRSLRAEPSVEAPVEAHADGLGLARAYRSSLLLTLTNPITILSFVGIMAGMGVSAASAQAWMLVLGVFLGSALWWLTLSSGVGLMRHRVGPRLMLWINRLSGLAILGFALRSLMGVLK